MCLFLSFEVIFVMYDVDQSTCDHENWTRIRLTTLYLYHWSEAPWIWLLFTRPWTNLFILCFIMYSRMNQSILVKHMWIPWVWMAQNLVDSHFLVGSMLQCLCYTCALLMFTASMFFICADMLVWWRRVRKEATAHCFAVWISFTPFVIYIGQCHVL